MINQQQIQQMLHKTEMSEVSTNAETRTTSFFTSKNREMYRRPKKGETSPKKNPLHQFSNQDIPNDLLFLSPNIINTLSWPSVWLFDSDITAAVKGNFYEISGLRGKKRFLPRNCEPHSELVHFWAEKPTQKFNLITIQRYLQQNSQLYLHFNLTKFNPSNNFLEVSDFYLDCTRQQTNVSSKEVWDLCSFEVIDQCRKGLLVVKVCNNEVNADNQYKVMLVQLTDRRKNTSKEYQSVQKSQLKIQCQYGLNCQLNFGREKEHFLKTIKSEFGDIVLVVTNMQIYEIEVEEIGDGYKMNLKPYKLSKSIANSKNNYFKHQNNQNGHNNTIHNSEEEIVDVRFMSNGLKLMILTNFQYIMVIEAHNFLFSQYIGDLFSAQNAEKYHLQEFQYEKLYPVNGSIAVEFNSKSQRNLLKENKPEQEDKQILTKGILILKVQNNSLSLGKIINLQIQHKDIQFINIRQCEGLDEILVQYIEKKQPYLVEVIKCRILMGELNAISKLATLEYNYSVNIEQKAQKLKHYHPQDVQKKYVMAEMPLASRIVYLLNEKQLTCYKLFSELDSEKINMELVRTFSTSFFQKPVKLTVSPLTGHFIIIFKEFVKFFFYNYSSIKNYYTLKIKNIVDAKYLGQGEKILLTCCDGKIHLIDAYSFRQREIMEYYGQTSEADMIDDKHLILKFQKNMLCVFRSGWDESQSRDEFTKLYEVKLDEGDLYSVDKRQIVVFKKSAAIQVYAHQPPKIPNNLPQAERECYMGLKAIHPNLVNKIQCNSFKEKEVPTKLLLTEQLGFIIVATNKGNIKQYLWPLQSPTNPNPPEVNTQQVSSCKILNLFLDAKLTYLYAINQNGTIIQLQINQYINGEEMPYVYIFSQKTRDDQMQKRQFTDRTYFIDHFTPTEMALTQASQQSIDELEFFIDKIKDDIEEMTKNMNAKWKAQEKLIKMNAKAEEKDFHNQLKADQSTYKEQLNKVREVVQEHQKAFQTEKNKAIEDYQKKLLALYKESDRLKGILKSQNEKLTEEKNKFIRDFQDRMNLLNQQKQLQVKQLLKQYEEIEEKRRLAKKQNEIFQIEEEAEMQLYKSKIHQQEQEQLDRAEEEKERLLGENTKKEKQINNLKHRSNYFQNLILQTKVQITQLGKDQEQYENKKRYLLEELKDKEDIIQKIERELVLYLKNTQDMKTIKNNHEFELQEYEKQVNPISQNFNQIQTNVKHMNQQIMKEYTLKIQKTEKIDQDNKLIDKLKEKKKKSIIKKLEISGKLNRIAEKLTYLATHPFDGDVKKSLKELIEEGDKSDALMKLDQTKQKQRRDGQKLIRYKNMIRKEIEQQQKRQEHIIKNQHQFYKYHNENTALVRQFNLLKKDQKYLQQQLNKLSEKVDIVKVSLLKTPMKRISSINLRKNNQIKLTPFQKYEEEQKSIIQRKNQETTDTKLSRNSQSLSFLKGLMKQLNTTESKNEKIEVMRERVRTFVNPEIKGKTEQIKKLLFGRGRGTSEMLKLG